MSSHAVGRLGLDLEGLELWLAGLFSAAELGAADLLLQLSVSVAKGVDDDDEAALSSSATTQSPSPRSAGPGCDSGDLTAEELEEEVKKELDERRVVEKPAISAELDRRARKRYRRLSELYAATSPVASSPATSADAKKKKRKTHHRHVGFGSSESSAETTREANPAAHKGFCVITPCSWGRLRKSRLHFR